MSDFLTDTRHGLTDADVAELLDILKDVSETTGEVTIKLLTEDADLKIDGIVDGDSFNVQVAKFANVYPFETAQAVLAARWAQELIDDLFSR